MELDIPLGGGCPRVVGSAESLVQDCHLGCFRTHGCSANAIDDVPAGEEHDPGHQFGPVRVKAVGRPPQAKKYLLYGILSLSIGREQLPGTAEDKPSKPVIQF